MLRQDEMERQQNLRELMDPQRMPSLAQPQYAANPSQINDALKSFSHLLSGHDFGARQREREALAQILSDIAQQEVDTLTDVVEPYLLQAGFLTRTSAGRRATYKAFEHLNLERVRGSSPQPELPLE